MKQYELSLGVGTPKHVSAAGRALARHRWAQRNPSELAEASQLYQDLGDALAVGLIADGMGDPSGADLITNIELYAETAAQPNPGLGSIVARIGEYAMGVLKTVAEHPTAILAVGGSIAAYAWMTSDERVKVEAINATKQTAFATLDACVKSGNQECLNRMSAASAQGLKDVANATKGVGFGDVAFIAVLAAGAYLIWGRR